MTAPGERRLVGADEPQVSLVNERRRLKRLPGRLASKPGRGKPPKLLVDNRQQLIGSAGVTLFDRGEYAGEVRH